MPTRIRRPRPAGVAARAWRRLGVRHRSALAAVGVVAVVLAGAAALFVLLHYRTLTAMADGSAVTRAQTIAEELITQGDARDSPLLTDAPGEVVVAQVLARDGRVLEASPNVAGQPALSPLRPGPGAMLREDRSIALTTEYPFRIVAVGVSTPAGDRVVLVGGSLMPAHESMETEIVLLAFGYPLLLLAVGTATAWFTGRSLRAVEAVRRRVAVITAEQLHERVPVPAARDEISHLAETMNAMLDRLQAAVAAQRRFVADASHELRSPLSTVQLGLELLHGKVRADTPLDEAAVATLRAEAERLEQLVADLLLLARTDERQTGRRADEVDLDDIVDAQARRLANRPDLTVAVAVAPVRVRGDREQLTRAVRNLVDNAARHATTRVALRLSVAGQSAQIEVADDGPGIPVADRGRVFERFVRLGDSRDRDGGGTGLGLAIVREVVASHGGTVGVYDTPGGGATIRITVPLEVPRPAADRPALASGRTSGQPSPQPAPATSR